MHFWAYGIKRHNRHTVQQDWRRRGRCPKKPFFGETLFIMGIDYAIGVNPWSANKLHYVPSAIAPICGLRQMNDTYNGLAPGETLYFK